MKLFKCLVPVLVLFLIKDSTAKPGILRDHLQGLASGNPSLLDPLGLFKHKDRGNQASASAHSIGSNLNLGPIGFSTSLSSAQASASSNGGVASADAKASAVANGGYGGGYGGANSNAQASANANAYANAQADAGANSGIQGYPGSVQSNLYDEFDDEFDTNDKFPYNYQGGVIGGSGSQSNVFNTANANTNTADRDILSNQPQPINSLAPNYHEFGAYPSRNYNSRLNLQNANANTKFDAIDDSGLYAKPDFMNSGNDRYEHPNMQVYPIPEHPTGNSNILSNAGSNVNNVQNVNMIPSYVPTNVGAPSLNAPSNYPAVPNNVLGNSGATSQSNANANAASYSGNSGYQAPNYAPTNSNPNAGVSLVQKPIHTSGPVTSGTNVQSNANANAAGNSGYQAPTYGPSYSSPNAGVPVVQKSTYNSGSVTSGATAQSNANANAAGNSGFQGPTYGPSYSSPNAGGLVIQKPTYNSGPTISGANANANAAENSGYQAPNYGPSYSSPNAGGLVIQKPTYNSEPTISGANANANAAGNSGYQAPSYGPSYSSPNAGGPVIQKPTYNSGPTISGATAQSNANANANVAATRPEIHKISPIGSYGHTSGGAENNGGLEIVKINCGRPDGSCQVEPTPQNNGNTVVIPVVVVESPSPAQPHRPVSVPVHPRPNSWNMNRPHHHHHHHPPPPQRHPGPQGRPIEIIVIEETSPAQGGNCPGGCGNNFGGPNVGGQGHYGQVGGQGHYGQAGGYVPGHGSYHQNPFLNGNAGSNANANANANAQAGSNVQGSGAPGYVQNPSYQGPVGGYHQPSLGHGSTGYVPAQQIGANNPFLNGNAQANANANAAANANSGNNIHQDEIKLNEHNPFFHGGQTQGPVVSVPVQPNQGGYGNVQGGSTSTSNANANANAGSNDDSHIIILGQDQPYSSIPSNTPTNNGQHIPTAIPGSVPSYKVISPVVPGGSSGAGSNANANANANANTNANGEIAILGGGFRPIKTDLNALYGSKEFNLGPGGHYNPSANVPNYGGSGVQGSGSAGANSNANANAGTSTNAGGLGGSTILGGYGDHQPGQHVGPPSTGVYGPSGGSSGSNANSAAKADASASAGGSGHGGSQGGYGNNYNQGGYGGPLINPLGGSGSSGSNANSAANAASNAGGHGGSHGGYGNDYNQGGYGGPVGGSGSGIEESPIVIK
ncbi:uncharacterized transmembrane protein DDB_G0289901-like isoform X2 [Prorops nasuta]|uniref:uncharacterized transmembrane protein DDB_G0289901-like isoform X2 n=1 Tax=Prorops nasuta TaxID=863751 RepID=UPI0034CD1BAF